MPTRARYRLPLLVLDATGMRVGSSSNSHGATWTSRADAGAYRRRRENQPRPLGAVPPASSRRCSGSARATTGARTACVRRVRRRQVPNRGHTGMHRRRRPGVLAARSPPPEDLAASPGRRPLGADRRARRPAQPRRHREHVHARHGRRGRTRLRGATCVTPSGRRAVAALVRKVPRQPPCRALSGLP